MDGCDIVQSPQPGPVSPTLWPWACALNGIVVRGRRGLTPPPLSLYYCLIFACTGAAPQGALGLQARMLPHNERYEEEKGGRQEERDSKRKVED